MLFQIDFSGMRKPTLQSSLWLEDCTSLDIRARKQLMVRLSAQVSPVSIQDHLNISGALFSYMFCILTESRERSLVIKALEFFCRAAQTTENSTVFAKCPQQFLDICVDLMCANFSCTDPFALMSQADPSTGMGAMCYDLCLLGWISRTICL